MWEPKFSALNLSSLSATHITEFHYTSIAPFSPSSSSAFSLPKIWIHSSSVAESKPEASSWSLLSVTIHFPPCKLFLTFTFFLFNSKFVELPCYWVNFGNHYHSHSLNLHFQLIRLYNWRALGWKDSN